MSRAMTLTIAAGLMAMAQTPAFADRMRQTTCFGGWGSLNCSTIWRNGVTQTHVRAVPGPQSEQDKAESSHRERLWVARCKPRMVVDGYGVQRYAYAASACDLGKYE